MTLASFLSSYGYPALLIGTFLEGETILVLGGLAAHQGYLSQVEKWLLVAVAAVGGLAWLIYFLCSRRNHNE